VPTSGNNRAGKADWVGRRRAPPSPELLAGWKGGGENPANLNPLAFRPAMLAHAIEEAELAALDPADYLAEWKWDGIRVQAVADGRGPARLYSRTGEDVSKSFPDLTTALPFAGAIDGELLVTRHGRVQSFNNLQQRLNRKAVTEKLMAEFPAHLRAYDLIVEGEDDLRERPFVERRARLETLVARV